MCKQILDEEGELWINYSPGINTKFNLARSVTPSILKGYIPRLLIFIRWLLIHFSLFSSSIEKKDFLVFSGTVNQLTSLKPIIKSMKKMNIESINLVDSNLPKEYLEHTNHQVVKFQPKIIFIGLSLLVSRFFNLLSNLRNKDIDLINRRLNTFTEIYFWLPFFINYLSKSNSNYILTSNDHNQSNRTLILAAQALDIKTVYIQHAAVSKRFHRLQFDYSFLDGQNALDTYRDCEKNASINFKPPQDRHIFLSGIKKQMAISKDHGFRSIGLAVKEADDTNEILRVIEFLSKHQYSVYIRFHPASSSNFRQTILSYKKICQGKIFISDPNTELVNSFFEKISTIIGSNSTIHLEARLSGLKSIYYVFGYVNAFDYYGFVEKGISKYAESIDQLPNLIDDFVIANSEEIEALRSYSYTYQTEWFNKEGDLMTHHLIKIKNDEDIHTLFGYRLF